MTKLRRIASAALAFAFMLALACCAKDAGDSYNVGMTLSSGMDKKVAMDYDSAATGSEAVMDESSGYEAGSASAQSTAASPSSPPQQADSKVSLHRLLSVPDVGGWIAPKAFAQDHQISEEYLVRSGTMALKTDNVSDSVKKITAIASKYQGGITGSSIEKDYEGHNSGFVTLRVPSKNFFDAFNELLSVAEVVSQNMKTDDVGQEYVAEISRLNSLMAEQETLQKMLDEALAVQRARGLGEAYKVMLDTQSRLSDVSAQIQQVETSAKALADRITRSTITVNLTENVSLPVTQPSPATFRWDLGPVFNESVPTLLNNIKATMHGLIRFIVSLSWIWWLLAFYVLRRYWKNIRRAFGLEADQRRIVPPPPTTGGGG